MIVSRRLFHPSGRRARSVSWRPKPGDGDGAGDDRAAGSASGETAVAAASTDTGGRGLSRVSSAHALPSIWGGSDAMDPEEEDDLIEGRVLALLATRVKSALDDLSAGPAVNWRTC